MLVKKILAVGDLHLGRLSYSEYIKDNRIKEKKAILDFIVEQSKDVDMVVLMGDNFNTKTPSAETVKEFTNFLERFENKRVVVLGGNHELHASGQSSLDYLKEIKNKNWKIVTNKIYAEDGMVFCPFFSNSFLGVDNNEESIKKILSMLPDGEILFIHMAISGCKTVAGALTDDFVEPVLPKDILSKKYKNIYAGHIHTPAVYGNIVITGSTFTNEVGEDEKFVWKLSDGNHEKIPLPVRKIIKIENPTDDELAEIDDDSIAKIIISKKKSGSDMLELKEKLKNKFKDNGAYLIVEKTDRKRERFHYGKGESITDMPIDRLLEIYAKQKKIDLAKLKLGFSLIIDESVKAKNTTVGESIYG